MRREQPTLHEAMVTILRDMPHQAASHRVLSKENRRRDLYRRRKDGKHPSPEDFLTRAAQSPYLFERLGRGELRLIPPKPRRTPRRR